VSELEQLLQKYWESVLASEETPAVIPFGHLRLVYHEGKLVEVAFELRTRQGKHIEKEGKLIR